MEGVAADVAGDAGDEEFGGHFCMINMGILCEIVVNDCRIKRSARKSMFVLLMVGLAMTSSDAVLTNQHSAPLSQYTIQMLLWVAWTTSTLPVQMNNCQCN